MSGKQAKRARKEAQTVTAEDAERMYAQAWPAKLAQVQAELDAATREIGERHGVIIVSRATVLPAFLSGQAAPIAAKLPAAPSAPPQEV